MEYGTRKIFFTPSANKLYFYNTSESAMSTIFLSGHAKKMVFPDCNGCGEPVNVPVNLNLNLNPDVNKLEICPACSAILHLADWKRLSLIRGQKLHEKRIRRGKACFPFLILAAPLIRGQKLQGKRIRGGKIRLLFLIRSPPIMQNTIQ